MIAAHKNVVKAIKGGDLRASQWLLDKHGFAKQPDEPPSTESIREVGPTVMDSFRAYQQGPKQSQIDYAMNFMDDAHKLWKDANVELRVRFRNMIFPEGVTLNTKTMEFGTTKISPFYRYVPNKKTLP